jgi:ABC-type multidrug transport system fused ATPase/permease subunit
MQKIYTYVKIKYMIFMTVLSVIVQQLEVWISYTLGTWANDKVLQSDQSALYSSAATLAGVTFMIAMMNVVKSYCLDWTLKGAIIAIKKDVLDCILNAPVSFFDTTPKETIMTRFNEDI